MTEDLNNNLGTSEKEKISEKKGDSCPDLSRRNALVAALLGIGASIAKTVHAAEASCSCLEAPDCSSICPNGGTPKADGSQACDCNPVSLATVAYTGKYSDLTGTPTIPNYATVAKTGSYNDLLNKPSTGALLSNIVTAGSAGTNSGITLYATINSATGNKMIKGPSASITVPYFSVNAQGCITSYTNRTVTFSSTTYYNYYNYDNYYAYYDSNCGDNCFISGKLITKEGPKNIDQIRIGDVLMGEDGEHRVLGIITGTIGANRFAISPVSDDSIVLTSEHIIHEDGEFVIYSRENFAPNRNLMKTESLQGTYDFEGLFDKCKSKPSSFVRVVGISSATKTYTFIVDKGLWGKTAGGTSVLLARVVKS